MRRAAILIMVIVGLFALPATALANDQAIFQDLVVQSIFILGPVTQLNNAKTPAAAAASVQKIITAARTAERKIQREHASTAAGAKCQTRGAAIFAGYVTSGKAIQAGILDSSTSEINQALRDMQAVSKSLVVAEKACSKLIK